MRRGDCSKLIIASFLLTQQTRPVSPAARTHTEVLLLRIFEKLPVGTADQKRGIAVEPQSGRAGRGGNVVELLLRTADLERRREGNRRTVSNLQLDARWGGLREVEVVIVGTARHAVAVDLPSAGQTAVALYKLPLPAASAPVAGDRPVALENLRIR